MCVDVSDVEAVKAAVKRAGTIHFVVNNAGISQLQSVLDTTPDVYDRYILCCLKLFSSLGITNALHELQLQFSFFNVFCVDVLLL